MKELDRLHRSLSQSLAAVERVKSALDLPFRPIPFQGLAEAHNDINAVYARHVETMAVLRRVEEWWVAEGMHKFDGAPECMFAVRALIEADKNA